MLRIDNRVKFCGKSFENFYTKHGISQKNKTPYTPQQNRVSKRMNRILMEKVRSRLNGNCGIGILGKTIDIVSYLVNRSSLMDLFNKTPYEAWDGKKPPLSHLRVFGCDSFVHVLKEKIGKIDRKSKKCIFIGYKDGFEGYKVWDIVTRKTTYNKGVIFSEDGSISKVEYHKRKKESEKIEFEVNDEGHDSNESIEFYEEVEQ